MATNRKVAKYALYRYTETIKVYRRNGSHPYPGELVREDHVERSMRLRVNEVVCYGITAAIKFERQRRIDARIRAQKRVSEATDASTFDTAAESCR